MSRIDLESLPEASVKAMARVIAGSLEAFYSDPANRQRFEDWKRERRKDESTG